MLLLAGARPAHHADAAGRRRRGHAPARRLAL